LLGTGGCAQVWEVEDEAGGRRVALKVLNRVDVSPQALERFEREGKLAASLNHPRCVYVFGAFEIEGRPAIAMEIVPAGSLEDRLRETGALPQNEAVDRILEIVDGLEAAHELGIVHRDVKPSNCFVDEDGRAKIGDFGISRSLEIDSRLTATGSFLGTPQYAAPEQVRGEDVDARTDLYSVGGTLYALLTGKPPFRADNAGKLLSEILTERPEPLSAHDVRVKRGLERVVMRLLEKDPKKRYPDAATLRSALVPFSSQSLTIAGVARRLGAFLLDDALTDFVLMGLFAIAGLSIVKLSQDPTLTGLGSAFALKAFWFTVFETVWGGTPCKRLLGLRVTALDRKRAPFGRVLVRNLVFFVMAYSGVTLAVALGAGPGVRGLLGPLGTLLVFLTMRASNGFAGIHELASGTRVMRLQGTVRAARATAIDAGAVGPSPLDPVAGSLGPYRLEGRIARAGNDELMLASDDALGRLVWIRTRPAGETSGVPWQVNRPGRLRRLQRGDQDGRSWEAFEALGGASLRRRIAAHGRLTWEQVREVLLTLVDELSSGREENDLPASVSLDHLWIDASGQLRLLDFPVREQGMEEASDDLPASEWRDLLHQLLLLCLEGRYVPPAELDDRLPRLPLPEHARRQVARICKPGTDPPALAWLQEELRASSTKSTHVTLRQRVWALMMSVVPVLPLTLGIAVGFAHDQLPNGLPVAVGRFLLGLSQGVGLSMAFGAVPAVLLTFVFRGGPWIRLFGIQVQTRDGRPASRLVCLFRGLVVYSPALWTAVFLATVLAGASAALPAEAGQREVSHAIASALKSSLGSMYSLNAWILLVLPGALFIAGTVQALIRPERGLADRIARTHLVPR